MRKIILSLVLVFGLMFSTVFSYDMTIKDKKIVNNINKKFDLINKKSPKKINLIYKKVQNILN
jgi:formiminotetrahydrofolate cyclodeaminase